MPVEQVETIMRAPAAALDTLARAVWQDHAAGRLADAEAQQLAEAIEARRRALRRPEKGPAMLRVAVTREETQTAASEAPRPAPGLRRNEQRQLVLRIPRPATYDRAKSQARRRMLAYAGGLPSQLRDRFTPGEAATLAVIGMEVREHGRCELPVDAIAAKAGVCRRTAQGALRLAERMGLIRIEERRREGARNMTNLVTVVSSEWRTWIERGPRRWEARGGCKTLHPTKTTDYLRRVEDGLRHDRGAGREGRSSPLRPRWSARSPQPALECWRGDEARAVPRQGPCPAP